jgi:hypothetical protein
MGRAKGIGLALAVALAALLPDACGDVTENSPTTTSPGGATGGTRADAQGRKDDKRKRDTGMVGSGGAAGGGGGAIPTEAYVPPCSICLRAENCCRAEGLSDCNYVATCAAAPTSEQQQFYVVLCRAVIEASSAGGKQPPDVCGF